MPLTPIEGASPANPADSLAGSVGVRGGGGDQVVVHITVESCLLGWGLLLHLRKTGHYAVKQLSLFKLSNNFYKLPKAPKFGVSF